MEWRCGVQEKKEKDFILGHFYIILNLEVGRKTLSPMAFRAGAGGSGQTHAYTCVNSLVP
jgi:hypothetical protein